LSFARVPPRPTPPANPLARRQRLAGLQAWERHRQAFVAERAEAVDAVRALTLGPTDATDIVGFLVKAGDLLATAPPGSQPVVVMTTDLQHNTDRDEAFDLHGAQVLLLVFQADDPTTARELRDGWQSRLLSAGASSVTIRDAMESADQVLDAPAVSPVK